MASIPQMLLSVSHWVFLQFYVYFRVLSVGLELRDTRDDVTVSAPRLSLTPRLIEPIVSALVPPFQIDYILRNMRVHMLERLHSTSERECLLVASA